MKIFIPVICIVSLAVAEPPVGNGYPSEQSSHDHSHEHDHEHDHSKDFQRSLSQEYGPPAAGSFESPRNALSTEYGTSRAANSRSSISQSYLPPSTRSGISQEYGVPSTRSSSQYSPSSRSLSTEYGVPKVRSGPSQSYGAPTARSGLSQEYDVRSVSSDFARIPSAQYGVPEVRSPSEEYGVPSQRNFGGAPSQKYGPPTARNSQFSRNTLSQEYGVPSARSGDFHQSHSNPRTVAKSFATSSPSSFKGSSQFEAPSLSTSHGSFKSASAYTENTKTLPQTYGAPNHQDLSDTVEVPSARSFPQEHVVPTSRAANRKTSSTGSSYSATARSAPSDTYGPQSARNVKPLDQYGAPEQYRNEGYPDARGALHEALNEEPASYDFAYKVDDYESGNDFGHSETRQDNRAEGSYFVVLPDGTKQVVEYEADERGFKPRISVEPADIGRSGGYDDNAAELTHSSDGPY